MRHLKLCRQNDSQMEQPRFTNLGITYLITTLPRERLTGSPDLPLLWLTYHRIHVRRLTLRVRDTRNLEIPCIASGLSDEVTARPISAGDLIRECLVTLAEPPPRGWRWVPRRRSILGVVRGCSALIIVSQEGSAHIGIMYASCSKPRCIWVVDDFRRSYYNLN